MLEINRTPEPTAAAMSSIFGPRLSMASMTTSGGPARIFSAADERIGEQRPGLHVALRIDIQYPFAGDIHLPAPERGIQRVKLTTIDVARAPHNVEIHDAGRHPTPIRASASTAYEPTAPNPTTATRDLESR